MPVQYQKCGTCHKVDVEYYPAHPATKDCLDCATVRLEQSEQALTAVLTTDTQKDLFTQYKEAFQARSMVAMSMS